MPDFNKGDFTQQGVNGHVNATVRLNEKRLVNIDLTSNEEAEGCTIVGTVKDLLNDKVYNIGSGGGGGGDIDLLHTTVTIINNQDSAFTPDYLLVGYSVLLSDFSELAQPVLHTKTSGDIPLCHVDLSDLPISIGAGESLTFDAYYTNVDTTNYSGGITAPESDAVATNMAYDDGWGIVDVKQNSTLTITVGK